MAGQKYLAPISPENHNSDQPEIAGGTVGADAEEGQGVEEGRSENAGLHDQIEEGTIPQRLPAPQHVSQAEREEHEVTHTPYRTWCKFCVQGRGRKSPHSHQDNTTRGRGVPKISLDYFFLSEVDKEASANPVLVMLDESTGERYARAVGRKGTADWLIKDLSDELKSWGHPGGEAGHLILKSDGEPAITAVCDALARLHGGKVVLERPPVGEHPSNGAIEEAGKTTREYARVLKLQLEDKAKSNYNLQTESYLG